MFGIAWSNFGVTVSAWPSWAEADPATAKARAAHAAAAMMRTFTGVLLLSVPKMASGWARKKHQECTEIMYYGGVSQPLNLDLDRTAKLSLAEQIRRGLSTAIDSGVLQLGARRPSWQDLAAQLGVA